MTPEEINIEELKLSFTDTLNAIIQQRNAALDNCVQQSVRVAKLERLLQQQQTSNEQNKKIIKDLHASAVRLQKLMTELKDGDDKDIKELVNALVNLYKTL